MNKKLVKWMAVFVVFTIFLGMFSNCSVSAKSNTKYGIQDSATIEVDEDAIIKSSIVTDYIGGFIYTIGTIIESLVSKIMQLFTGNKVFPWADKIIFNAVPLLDVNFINPDANSILVESDSRVSIGAIVRSVYFTGLSLALGFLAIIIAVMAIKLALSTISSEKAKYKEAIVKWLTSMILLFGMHFFLSFIFYMNEQLVEIASTMMTGILSDEYHKVEQIMDNISGTTKDKVIDNFLDSTEETVYLSPAQYWNSIKAYMGEIGKDLKNFIGLSEGTDFISILTASENRDIVYALLNNKVILEKVIPNINGNSETTGLGRALSSLLKGNEGSAVVQAVTLADIVNDVKEYQKLDLKKIDEEMAKCQEIMDEKENDGVVGSVIDFFAGEGKRAEIDYEVYKLARAFKVGTVDSDAKNKKAINIMSSLGTYFKDKAWYTDVSKGEWSANSVSITSAILYTIFVIQSLMFFIAYIKRFFYVIVLSTIAPFVVIYDFFVKSATL